MNKQKMNKQKIIVAMLVAGGLVSPVAHATNGYFSHGYGIKSKSMAGVGIALPQDSLAAATNPAGMVMVGDKIDLGLDWFRPTRGSQFIGTAGGALDGTYDANDTHDFFIPEFGYNKMINADTSLGVSVYGNGGMNTDYKTNPLTGWGGTGSAGVNLEQLFIAPTWSMKFSPTNSIGISLNLAYQSFEANGLQPFDNGGASSAPGFVTNKGKDSSTGYGLRLGWIGQVTPNVTLGATYQTKTNMSKLDKYKGLFAEQGGFDIPANYGVGIAVKAAPETTIAFDIESIQYGDVKSIANSYNSSGLLGANNGQGFGWKDITVYKLGASHAYSSNLVLRGGISVNDQPIPAGETFFNFLAPGIVRSHATLGVTWKLENKAELTVGYMHAFKKTVNGSGSLASSGGGEVNLNMYEDSIGIAYGWKL